MRQFVPELLMTAPGCMPHGCVSRFGCAALSIALLCAPVGSLMADTFVLAHGGKLEGTLLNPDQDPRSWYEIQTDAGIRVAVEARRVKQVIPQTEAQRQYEALLPRMPATADGNWKMADWCQQNKLTDEATFHLREVLRLDPEHTEARKALGFRQIEGRWMHPDDWFREQGFVRHRGKWRLPQDIELERAQERAEAGQREWRRKLRTWRGQLGRGRPEREQEVLQNLRAIDDPLAATPVAELLDEEEQVALCREYIAILGRLQNGVATKALIHTAINHRDSQVREAALEPLARHAAGAATRVFRAALAGGNRRHMLNAATGLGRMGRAEAIPDLIDVLVTQHKVQVQVGGPGQIGASFGSGGSGLSLSGKPKIIERTVENQEVLDALLALVDAPVNHLYDQDAWRAWYRQSQAPPPDLSLRRSR